MRDAATGLNQKEEVTTKVPGQQGNPELISFWRLCVLVVQMTCHSCQRFYPPMANPKNRVGQGGDMMREPCVS